MRNILDHQTAEEVLAYKELKLRLLGRLTSSVLLFAIFLLVLLTLIGSLVVLIADFGWSVVIFTTLIITLILTVSVGLWKAVYRNLQDFRAGRVQLYSTKVKELVIKGNPKHKGRYSCHVVLEQPNREDSYWIDETTYKKLAEGQAVKAYFGQHSQAFLKLEIVSE